MKKGKPYEDSVASFLTSKGVKILKRNYRSRFGEIDLLGCYKTKKGEEVLLIVEIKGSSKNKNNLERIDCRKLKKLLLTVKKFLAENPHWENKQIVFLGADVFSKKVNLQKVSLEDCPQLGKFFL
jgi:putative endonuclease